MIQVVAWHLLWVSVYVSDVRQHPIDLVAVSWQHALLCQSPLDASCPHRHRCEPHHLRSLLQELVEGPWRHNSLDAGAAMVIPVPLPLGGVVVVGEAVVTYINGAQPAKTVPLKSTIVRVRARLSGVWSGLAFLRVRHSQTSSGPRPAFVNTLPEWLCYTWVQGWCCTKQRPVSV